jgi:hypothetical protein
LQRACERGNLLVAEIAARELGRITLDEALALTVLIAKKDPRRRSRVCGRWLLRFLEEQEHVTIEEAALAAAALAALGGLGHDDAHAALRAMSERVTRRQAGGLSR